MCVSSKVLRVTWGCLSFFRHVIHERCNKSPSVSYCICTYKNKSLPLLITQIHTGCVIRGEKLNIQHYAVPPLFTALKQSSFAYVTGKSRIKLLKVRLIYSGVELYYVYCWFTPTISSLKVKNNKHVSVVIICLIKFVTIIKPNVHLCQRNFQKNASKRTFQQKKCLKNELWIVF